jgi:preprotein translocase subunit SecE
MKAVDYVKETRGELKHVSWPTRKQAVAYTIIIIAVSVITAAFLGVFDYIFSVLLKALI